MLNLGEPVVHRGSITLLTVLLALVLACTGGESNPDVDSDGDDGGGSTTAAVDGDGDSDGDSDGNRRSNGSDNSGSSGSGSSSTAPVTHETQQLIAALERTQVADAYQFEMAITMSGIPDAPFDISFTSDGALDPANERFRMRMDMSSLFAAMAVDGGDLDLASAELMQAFLGDGIMEMVAIGDTVYMRFALFSMLFGAPTEWIAITDAGDTDVFGELSGSSLGGPEELLASLESIGSVTVEGTEDVRGVKTTRYRALIDWDTALNALSAEDLATLPPEVLSGGFGDVPLNVWIDGDGLVRRVQMTIDLDDFAGSGEQLGVMSMVVEYFGFGDTVVIEPPPANEVTELDDEFFEGALGLFGS